MIVHRRRKFILCGGIIILATSLISLETYVLSPDVRIITTRAASGIGAWDTVTGMLDDQDHQVRTTAGDMLVERGEKAVAPLIRGLERLPLSGRQMAAITLSRMGVVAIDAIPALEIAIRADPDPSARLVYARAMSTIAPLDARVIRIISGLLTEEDEHTRVVAAELLGKLGPQATEVIPVLIMALRDASPLVRREAAESLGQFGPSAKVSVPALIAALTDESPEVRMETAEALGSIGPLARDAVPALNTALRDPHPKVRSEAEEALKKIR
ncbi:HEAT repeat domain-containing protein [Zavarzinella formosa]|uniref:HEAT repeat domain-containing protein n=1 Tax=Zavarzinella formosa TaxID=360055 RepID=UPI000318B681|nr:HEAT repeat domain-containing protein [Zavarzinella formosa]